MLAIADAPIQLQLFRDAQYYRAGNLHETPDAHMQAIKSVDLRLCGTGSAQDQCASLMNGHFIVSI